MTTIDNLRKIAEDADIIAPEGARELGQYSITCAMEQAAEADEMFAEFPEVEFSQSDFRHVSGTLVSASSQFPSRVQLDDGRLIAVRVHESDLKDFASYVDQRVELSIRPISGTEGVVLYEALEVDSESNLP